MIVEFMRNKMVDVAHLDAETLSVHGVLTDSIYSLELDFKVRISDLVCSEVEGRWLRWTTPQCPRALTFLNEADGFCLAPGIDARIHKTMGRRACRHFANLFIECAYAVRETVKMLRWQAAVVSEPDLTLRDFIERGADDGSATSAEMQNPASSEETLASAVSASNGKASGKFPADVGQSSAGAAVGNQERGFVIDLHLHTAPASPCASSSVDEMIVEAKRIGLDGICLSDHNYLWSAEAVQALREKHNFLVLRVNEIVTEQGDMLVFGFYEDVQGIIRLAELKQRVAAVGGFIVAAHPFRGFLTFGADDVGLTPEKAMAREMFKWVDGVECLNGKVTVTENGLARHVATGLGLPATGGSDAHDVSTVGVCATAFESEIKSEEDLLAALKAGKYRPVNFR
ncbi:MAG: PHP domain-containing protein [Deltaproteobacteria bacterium]|nr:PHP domain-containing protein [Deltaproteobacteria bacterium]